MKYLAVAVLVLALLTPAWADEDESDDGGQPGAVSNDGYLPPERHNVYGPGEHSDATGRPFHYETQDGQRVVIEPVKPDAYGPGVGMDVYGRPVYRQP